MLTSKSYRLGRLKVLAFLDELESTEGYAQSLYLPAGLPQSEVGSLLRNVLSEQATPPDLAEIIVGSETGATVFWGSSRRCLILPPFPFKEQIIACGYVVGPLCSLLKRDFIVALVLVRLGEYAIGISQGEQLIASKVGTGLVHARHRKGGSSQQRFQRHREKQIEYFLDRVCGHIREQFEPYIRSLDYIVYGGSRAALLSLRKRCSFLTQFDDRALLRPLLTIPGPRRAVLEAAISRVWSSSVTELFDN